MIVDEFVDVAVDDGVVCMGPTFRLDGLSAEEGE